MKAIEWERYFARQQREHGKKVFTAAELANAAHASPSVANVMLARLVRNRVLERAARGLYAIPGATAVDDLLPLIDPAAYMTAARVLFDAGLITQFPEQTLCFTSRRHFSPIRATSLGRLAFQIVRAPIYSPPTAGVRASPEQALFDLALTTPAAADLRGLYTARKIGLLRRSELNRLAPRYPADVRLRVNAFLSGSARP